MKRKNFSLQKGQSLIEALGALAIIAVVVSAITVSVTTALSNAKYNRNQTMATKYAQQGTEIIRQIRDDDYAGFKTKNGTYCLAKNQTTLGSVQSSCTTLNVDNFIRSVQIEQVPGCAANVAKVMVNVSFTDGKCSPNTYCHTLTNTSCLSTVNPIQAP